MPSAAWFSTGQLSLRLDEGLGAGHEGLIIVEDIETTLRHYIEAVYETERRLEQALINVFGANGDLPNRGYEQLTFGQYAQLIHHKKNWADFEPYFSSPVLFDRLMNEVRQIRNQIAHFRGDLDTLQKDALLRARDWLASRPKPKRDKPILLTPRDLLTNSPEVSKPELTSGSESGKSTPLTTLLQHRSTSGPLQISLEEIEKLLPAPLPSSAYEHRSWWANDTSANRYAQAWLSAGWLVDDVDFANKAVVFRRTTSAHYQLFFENLVQRVQARRPGLIHLPVVQPKSWFSFASGVSGFSYGWNFSHGPRFYVYLYIATGRREANKQYFDILHAHKDAVEAKMGVQLDWERLDDKGASRVRLGRANKVTDPPEQLELLKVWAVDTMLLFIDTFQPLLRELFSE